MKFTLMNLRPVLVILVLSGCLSSIENNHKHIPEGTQLMSSVDLLAMKEEKVLKENEGLQEGAADLETLIGNLSPAFIYSGVYHVPKLISPKEALIELEDGSIWSVHSKDCGKMLEWKENEPVVIMPNKDWFSSYGFRIQNANTSVSVQVNLLLGPIYHGVFTHWIIDIDYINRMLVLEDGSVWQMGCCEDKIVKEWSANDTILIGNNNSLVSSYFNPNILININMLNYSIGKYIGISKSQ